MNLLPTIARRRSRERSRGQSLAEFALVLPVILFITLIALDFGRVYLGYINLQNMARIAANYASNNATAWADNDTVVKATYQSLVRNDALATNCQLPLVGGVRTAPDPAFPSGTSFGDTAEVAITCTFPVITPFVSQIVGNSVAVSASAAFPIRTGQMASDAGGGPVTAAPNPAFSADDTYGPSPRSVQFHDESGGYPTGWLWDFGDGTTSTDRDPVHVYIDERSYDVSLIVTNSFGSSEPLVKTNFVTVVPAADVDFTADKTTGLEPLTVKFTDFSTVASISAWLWDFGDGDTSTDQHPTHTYTTANTDGYTVTLTVTSAGGPQSLTKDNYITVNVPTCTVPTLVGEKFNSSQTLWEAADFTTTVEPVAGAPKGNFEITYQTITGKDVVPCNSPIEVNGK